jgi:hypothetical protein
MPNRYRLQVIFFTVILSVSAVSLAWARTQTAINPPSYERTRLYTKSYNEVWEAALKSIPKWKVWMLSDVTNERVHSALHQDRDASLIQFSLLSAKPSKQQARTVKMMLEQQEAKVKVSINCPDSSGVVEEYLFSRIERHLGLIKDDFQKQL